MECNAVHSRIERRLNERPIYLPVGYVSVTKRSREKPVASYTKNLTYYFRGSMA